MLLCFLMGTVFDIQRYSIDDGPGIRTTIFFKGCPLSCKWCHNPEGIKTNIEIGLYHDKCITCKKCMEVCEMGAHFFEEKHIFNRDKCNFCMRCVAICPSNALIAFGGEVTVDELIKEILKDKSFYDFSGGGVTLSGGEPTLQMNFIKEILSRCKDNNIHTAIETCGFFNYKEFGETIEMIDLVIFDVKVFDSAKHREYTGVDNRIILSNLKKLSKDHLNIWMRVPLIPGVNTDIQEIREISEFTRSLDNVKRVEILPFHRFGIYKYKALGIEAGFNCSSGDIKSELDRSRQLFKGYLGEMLYCEEAD